MYDERSSSVWAGDSPNFLLRILFRLSTLQNLTSPSTLCDVVRLLLCWMQILQYVLIPCFAISFERDEGERLIGSPPFPDQENPDNVISVFINNVIDPDNPFGTSDAVRILLLQFSSLLVEQASHHIHDAANKYVWKCRQSFFPSSVLVFVIHILL